MQNQQKTINWEAIYTHNVHKNRLNFDYITYKHVINGFILHHKSFMRIWDPIVNVQVKISKLASIPPMWANHAPNQTWMAMNCCVDMDEVTRGHHNTLESIGMET